MLRRVITHESLSAQKAFDRFSRSTAVVMKLGCVNFSGLHFVFRLPGRLMAVLSHAL
jgi:hypothetical protein